MIGTDENRAALHVEVIFWSGKRKIPPSLVSGKYCPHFVVIGTTEYLGVCFLDGTECTFDTPALGNAQPLYPDTIDYAPLENNAEFLIYEGANAVGKGRVLGRTVRRETDRHGLRQSVYKGNYYCRIEKVGALCTKLHILAAGRPSRKRLPPSVTMTRPSWRRCFKAVWI